MPFLRPFPFLPLAAGWVFRFNLPGVTVIKRLPSFGGGGGGGDSPGGDIRDH